MRSGSPGTTPPARTMATTRHSHGEVHNSPALPVSRPDRLIVWICVAATVALAWAYLIHLGRQMANSAEYDAAMAAMGMAADGRWTATDMLFTFVMWFVMMVGMMAGSALPILLLVAGARKGSSG